MTYYYPTHILKLLIHRKLLKGRLSFLFARDAIIVESFLERLYYNHRLESEDSILVFAPALLKFGLISSTDRKNQKEKCSLMFADVVNFELTYKCQYRCQHCQQSGYKIAESDYLITEEVKNTVLQAYLSSLCKKGINYTGGEVIGNRDDLFEILDYTQSLNIPYRINTNCWWAGKRDFKVCGTSFSEPIDLVQFLKTKGLFMFAFSFDDRFQENKAAYLDLIESIRQCEKAKMLYQIIFTGIEPHKIYEYLGEISRKCGFRLIHSMPVSMQMVDIGGASSLDKEKYRWQTNRSSSEKCFSRPQFITISPDGKVRTCIYANGLANVGNLKSSSLTDMINDFPYNAQNAVFSDYGKYKELVERLIIPYKHIYKPVIHGCTRKMILARTIEMYSEADPLPLNEIHITIAREMNLLNEGV